MELVRTVLALRAIPKLPYRELRDVALSGADSAFVDLVRREQQIVLTLARAPAVRDLSNGDPRPAHALSRRMGQMEVLLPVDEKFLERERAALQKEIERANTETVVLERKLASHGFLEKAPPAVVEKEKARLQELRAHIAMSSQRLSSL